MTTKINRPFKTIVVTLAALALSLFAVTAFAQDGEEAAADEAAPAGAAAIYADNCVRCHGEDGQAATRMGERYGVTPFTAEFLAGLGEDTIRDAITNGRENMRPLEGVSEDDVTALIEYVLTLASQ